MTNHQKHKLLVLARYDSFIKESKKLADAFLHEGYDIDFFLVGKSSQLSKRQRSVISLPSNADFITNKELKNIDFNKYSAMLLGLTGGYTRDFFTTFAKRVSTQQTPRPILITGYPGVVLRERKFGFANRSCCDFCLLNSLQDISQYKTFCKDYSLDSSNSFLYGYNFPPNTPRSDRSGYEKRILFAEQAIIPETRTDRMYILHRLLDYAQAYPRHQVVFKPRLTIKETALFTPKFHMEDLLHSIKKLRTIPQNFLLSYDTIDTWLECSDMCVTISSTVALQALSYGMETRIIKDFGPNEEFGTDFFRESGCLCTFDELIAQKKLSPNPTWLHDNISKASNHTADLVHAVKNLYTSQIDSMLPLKDNFSRIFSSSWLNYLEECKKSKHTFACCKNYIKTTLSTLRRAFS